MTSPCGTCGPDNVGPGWILGQCGGDSRDKCHSYPCPTCQRIVSLEAAAKLDALNEIERLGLDAHYTLHDRNGMPMLWQVHEWSYYAHKDDEWNLKVMGEGDTLPLALSAYLAASKGAAK